MSNDEPLYCCHVFQVIYSICSYIKISFAAIVIFFIYIFLYNSINFCFSLYFFFQPISFSDLLREDFKKRIITLESQLNTVILNDIQREIQNNENRIKDSIAPYSRFIQIEKKKVLNFSCRLSQNCKFINRIQNFFLFYLYKSRIWSY